MPTTTPTLIAVLTAKPTQRENLRAALKALITPSRAEPGCLDYTLFELAHNPDSFYVRERWKDQQAFATHIELPHFQAFVRRMNELLAEPLRMVELNEVEP